jgi:hypothetical protein
MKQLIINKNDIYEVENISYFKFTYKNINLRDVSCDLSKNSKLMLVLIYKYCEIKYSGLKKKI